jgi:acyl carrier protein
MVRDTVLQEIYTAIYRANEIRKPEERLLCAEETQLYGTGSGLDSLGLVSLILDVEDGVNARFGTELVVADAHAMSLSFNPFKDVRSLTDYVVTRLAERPACKSNPSS